MCDTFAVPGAFSAFGRNLLAKNSDRPLGEAQPLFVNAACDHQIGERLHTTNMVIDQAAHTYAVLGCKPYWIWGFEMGVNEKGVAIGNEAQGSKIAHEDKDGLLGMDLLRLGLERGATALEAVQVITSLLEQYGQNANASPLFDRRYENSFMIADSTEIWLLETAGREWAAKRVEGKRGISNCYSIGSDYDMISKNAEPIARERHWLRPDDPMDFTRAFTLPAPRQANAVPRWRRLNALLGGMADVGFDEAKSILRDHFDGEINAPRFDPADSTFATVCMHSATWDSAQTTVSMLCAQDAVLGLRMRFSFSLPCCGCFIPVYFTGRLPEIMTTGQADYDDKSLWWQEERAAMLVCADYEKLHPMLAERYGALEAEFEREADQAEAQARELIGQGQRDAANELLNALTARCADRVMAEAQALAKEAEKALLAEGGLFGTRKDFLEEYAARVHMPLL